MWSLLNPRGTYIINALALREVAVQIRAANKLKTGE